MFVENDAIPRFKVIFDAPVVQGERKVRMLRDSSHLNLDQIRQFIDILGKIRQFLGLRVLGNKL